MLYSELPQKPGVYFFKDQKGKVLYVGKALNLKKRVALYFRDKDIFTPRISRLISQVKKVQWQETASEVEALILEANLIKKFKPKYNVRLKDDKSFLYIKITGEKFPAVLSSRKKGQRKDLFFGPFPSAKTARMVLKLLRRAFLFRTCLRIPKKPCLYYHLGLCRPSPCLNKKYQERKEYLQNIENLKLFLAGKDKLLIKKLLSQMTKFSKNKKFEEAAILRDQIKGLEYISEKRIGFDEDLGYFGKDSVLSLLSYLGDLKKLKRIEGYDVSNISGREATASMVVFENGLPKKEDYRRFKIKTVRSVNDCAMLKEVFLRRFKRFKADKESWPLPDLVLIDGGKPQLSAALEVILPMSLKIPFLGLAKKEEVIIFPFFKSGKLKFKELRLEKTSNVLNFLKMIRDESHRFAKKYYHYLRKKILTG